MMGVEMRNSGYAYTTTISSRYAGEELRAHLAGLYPHSSAAEWQEKLDGGEVTLDGVRATGSERVALGQRLVWNRPPWEEPDAPGEFGILYEDEHLVAVNKPGGLPTLPGGGGSAPAKGERDEGV
jgi:23S rRNA pseudouridine1911/1915/1917 synthase